MTLEPPAGAQAGVPRSPKLGYVKAFGTLKERPNPVNCELRHGLLLIASMSMTYKKNLNLKLKNSEANCGALFIPW